MTWRLLFWAALAVFFAGAAATIPAPGPGEHFGRLGALSAVGAGCVFVFATIVFVIALDAGEWSPVALASGCIAMSEGIVLSYLFDGHIGFIPSSTGAGLAPVWGLASAGALFALASRGAAPVSPGGRTWVRLTLVLAPIALAAPPLLFVALPEAIPSGWVLNLAAGGSAAAYLAAGAAFLRVHRFLRLPFSAAVAGASFAFCPLVLVVSAGGIVGLPDAAIEAAALSAGVLPVAAFIMEQRSRPGLRTIVLGISFPGAVGAFRRGHPAALRTLLAAASTRDGLEGHLDRVADLSVSFGAALGLGAGELRLVSLAAQAHDIGKVYVPASILDKPGNLTDRERDVVREHSRLGCELLARAPGLTEAAPVVRDHHERWDGTGYPAGRAGTSISRAARLLAITDVFDALTHSRSYKGAWTIEAALAEIERDAGSHFDPELARLFVRYARQAIPRVEEEQGPRRAISLEAWRRQHGQHRGRTIAA